LPGTPFHDSYRLALLRDGLYHPDGQIRDEVYVFGSFLQSKMRERGVRCTDCHDPHSAQTVAEGNAVCTQCHSPVGNAEFASLNRGTYDTADHHRHKPDTAGALCVNCHMPGQTYMGIDFRRDHSFRVPRPDLTVEIATPNACSDCHAEKGADWAAEQVKVWFPEGRNGRAHFGKIFAKARRQLDEALVRQLIGLALDEKTSGIVRATALELLRSAPSPAVAAETTELLNADDVLVRTAAIALQRGAPAQIRAERLAPLLSNPYRVIRIEAARALLDVPRALYPPKHVAAVDAAMREYQLSLVAKADFPETQLVIAGTAFALRNLPAADSALKTALSMDPQIGEAWLMLARLPDAGAITTGTTKGRLGASDLGARSAAGAGRRTAVPRIGQCPDATRKKSTSSSQASRSSQTDARECCCTDRPGGRTHPPQ
jgi:hypothetical protein